MKRAIIILISIVSVLFLCSCPPSNKYEPQPADLSRGLYLYDNNSDNENNINNSYYLLNYSNSDYNKVRANIYASSYSLRKSYFNIDEIVNNFSYTYNGINDDDDFKIIPNIVKAPWNESRHLVTLAVQSKQTEIDNTAGNNYVFLIAETFFFGTEYGDPMYGEKLTNKYIIFKNSFIKFLNSWNNPNDKISIIAGKSATTAKLICDGAQIDQKEKIINALENIKNYNFPLSTTYNEKEFIYNVVDKNYIENGNNHLICMEYYLKSRFPDSSENNDNFTKQYYYSSLICNNSLKSNANNVHTDCPNDYLNGGFYSFSNSDELDNIFNNGFRTASIKIGKNAKFSVEFNSEVVEEYERIGYNFKSMSYQEYEQLPTPNDVFTYSNTTIMYLYEVKLKDEIDDNSNVLEAKVLYEDPNDNSYKELSQELKTSQIGNIPLVDYDFIVYAVEMGLYINKSKLLKYEDIRTMEVTLITKSRNFQISKKDMYMKEFATLMAKAIAQDLVFEHVY